VTLTRVSKNNPLWNLIHTTTKTTEAQRLQMIFAMSGIILSRVSFEVFLVLLFCAEQAIA